MVEYKCEKCNKLFKKKFNYEKHIDRKYSCVTGVNTVDQLKIMLENQQNEINELKKMVELLILK
jgi:uncharacterized C2H2 Zn-finger protein